MDRLAFFQGVKKNRYILLTVLVGVLLMSVPERNNDTQLEKEEKDFREQTLADTLSEVLGKLSGAGRVEVLLTVQEGERIVFENDEVIGNTETRKDTVLVSDASRTETGLIRQTNPPVYRGAVVLCQGADNAQVKLAIVEAVKCATGLSANRITVLKMK